MGSCCSLCCPKEKYPLLEKAQLKKRTKKHKKICMKSSKAFSSRAELNRIVNNEETTKDLKMVLQSPYSDFSHIMEGIYLTSVGGLTKENIFDHKINYIINVSFETPNFKVKGIQCIRVPIDDESSEDIYVYFNEVSEKLNEITKAKGKVVVHCLAGVSRSVTLVLAYLMKFKKMSLKDAFKHIYIIRSKVKPNVGFFQQLIHYEKELYGINSVQMKQLEIHDRKIIVPDIYITDCPAILDMEIQDALGNFLRKDKLMDELTERTMTAELAQNNLNN